MTHNSCNSYYPIVTTNHLAKTERVAYEQKIIDVKSKYNTTGKSREYLIKQRKMIDGTYGSKACNICGGKRHNSKKDCHLYKKTKNEFIQKKQIESDLRPFN